MKSSSYKRDYTWEHLEKFWRQCLFLSFIVPIFYIWLHKAKFVMSHVAHVSDVAHGPLVYDNVSALKILNRKANHLIKFFDFMRFFRLDPHVHPIFHLWAKFFKMPTTCPIIHCLKFKGDWPLPPPSCIHRFLQLLRN